MAKIRDLFDEPADRPAALDKGAAGRSYTAKDIEVLEGLEPVRRRPGMYIGGTDQHALHHLAAEILDNAMDEAVAGHASRIEVELKPDGVLIVRDNGRGIPVDPHPKFKNKSALEVIMTTLHAGGKFGGKVYDTSGGLHGVGASVVNALSEWMEVEVAREKRAYKQRFERGHATTKLKDLGPAPNRRGTIVSFKPDAKIFGTAQFSPATLYRMARSKAYLFRGVEIRWKCDPSLLKPESEIPAEDVLKFPGGLLDFLKSTLGSAKTVARPFFGQIQNRDGKGAVEWAIAWTPEIDPFVNSYCNTIPTLQGGTHEQGLRGGLTRSLRAYGERAGNRKTALITPDDVMAGACAVLSIFIREPEFQGQTKEKLSSADAQRLVENALRDHFDHFLSEHPQEADALLCLCDRCGGRAAETAAGTRGQPQSRHAQIAASGQAHRLHARGAERHRDFPGGRGFRRRIGETGARPCHPGGASLARQDLERGERGGGQIAAESGTLRSGAGARLRHGRQISRRGFALRARHHHDRCRCRRRAHRVIAADLLLSRDEGADRQRPSLSSPCRRFTG